MKTNQEIDEKLKNETEKKETEGNAKILSYKMLSKIPIKERERMKRRDVL